MRQLLHERLRPTVLADLFQPPRIVQRLEQMVRDRAPMNMLFYGKPGVGKTSAALILLKELNADFLQIDGSSSTGIDTIREDIERYCSSSSLFDAMKAVFIDECEFLSKSAQAAMRGTIEKHSTVPFLLTANDTSKLHPAMKSRCIEVCFDVGLFEATEVVERLLPRYHAKVLSLGCDVTLQRLRETMYLKFPDLRAVANALEFEVGVTS